MNRLTTWVLITAGLAIPCYADPLGPQGRDDLLKSLHDCLAKMPKYVSRLYILPCAGWDVSSIRGMTIAALSAAIGPPHCIGPKPDRFQLTDSACPEGASPQWSFSRLPKKVTAGGGAELRCVVDAADPAVCADFKWLYFQ